MFFYLQINVLNIYGVNAGGGRKGPDSPIFDLQGSIDVLDPCNNFGRPKWRHYIITSLSHYIAHFCQF